MRRFLLLLLLTLSTGCGGSGAPPCDRYASAGAGTAQRLADALAPGEVGCLRGGGYTGRPYVLRIVRDGVTLRSAPGQRARLRGIVEVAADGVTLSGLAVAGSGAQNAVKVYSADVTISGSDISTGGRPGSCVLLGSNQQGTAVRPVVRGNVLHDCGDRANANKDHAIYAARVRGGVIAENLILRPAAYAVQLYPDARDVRVVANIADGAGSLRGGVVIGSDASGASRDNRVERNVIYAARPKAFNDAWAGAVGRGNVVRANCVSEPVGELAGIALTGNLTTADPFRGRRSGDYRLLALSPCRALLGSTPAARRTAMPRP